MQSNHCAALAEHETSGADFATVAAMRQINKSLPLSSVPNTSTLAAKTCPICLNPASKWLDTADGGGSLGYLQCNACGSVWQAPHRVGSRVHMVDIPGRSRTKRPA
jgi:hypothetical protein